MALTDKLTNIANAVRAKTGGTATLTLDQMASDLNAIQNKTSSDLTVSGATVTVPAGNYKSQATKTIVSPAASSNITLTSSDTRKVVVGRNDVDGVGGSWVTTNSDGTIRLCTAIPTSGYYTASSNIVGVPITTQGAKTITPSTSSQTAVASGVYTTGAVTVAAIPSSYVKPTATKAAATITPTTSNQTIAAGTYCSGAQTIAGDADLVAGNIKKGVNIFGVAGSYEGAELNFKVVGGTSAPSNPTENTIWVNTSTTITDWVFSATQPSAASGRVWISVGTSSPVTFNALKQNNLQVYPIFAKQYVSGKWVDKTAKSYYGSSWVELLNPDVAKMYNLVEVRENGTGGATVTGRVIDFTSTSNSSGHQGYACWYSTEKIDVSGYSKLTFKATRSSFGQAFRVGFRNINTDYWTWHTDGMVAYVDISSGTKSYTLDISSLNSSYYFFAGFAGETSAGTATMKLSDLNLT